MQTALSCSKTQAIPAPLTAPMTLPWDYIASTENHGPYITTEYGSTVCDFYCMSRSPFGAWDDRPIPFMAELADEHAAYAVRAVNAHEALVEALRRLDAYWSEDSPEGPDEVEASWAALLGRHADNTVTSVWRDVRAALRLAATTPHEGRRPANDDSQDGDDGKDWVIRKRGMFYRPFSKGYTYVIEAAGRYTEAEARSEAEIEASITAHRRSEFEPREVADGRDWVVVAADGEFFKEPRKGTTPHLAAAYRYTEAEALELAEAGLPFVTARRVADDALESVDAFTARIAAQQEWRVSKCDDGVLMVHTEGDTICFSDPNHQEPDDSANMRKISANPELLAFAIAHDAYMLAMWPCGPDSPLLNLRAAANWRACRAAVAKALPVATPVSGVYATTLATYQDGTRDHV